MPMGINEKKKLWVKNHLGWISTANGAIKLKAWLLCNTHLICGIRRHGLHEIMGSFPQHRCIGPKTINSKEFKNPVKVNGTIKIKAFNKFGRASKSFIVK
jgi:hypothetical protein